MKSKDKGLESKGWGKGAGFRGRRIGRWGFGIILAIAVAGMSGLAKQGAESAPSEEVTIDLHVYDYAQVDPMELARAQDEASRVLQRIGIQAVWLNCPVPGMERENTQECGSIAGALLLRILPQAMAERLGRPKGSLGFAQTADDGTPGFVATVLYNRVQSMAAGFGCPSTVVLGYVLAHEIGHLLLGNNSHSPNGIMRAQWTETELRAASMGHFGFFPQQGVKMRAGVRSLVTHRESTLAAQIVSQR